MSFRKRVTRWKDDLTRRINSDHRDVDLGSPSETMLQDRSHVRNPPVPSVTKHKLVDVTQSVAAQGSTSSTPALPAGHMDGQPSSTTLPSNLPPSISAPSNASEVGGHTREATWIGLKGLLNVLESGADAFGPLRPVVDGLNQCIDIYESHAKGRQDYDELRTTLNSLLEDLRRFFSDPVPPVITTSMSNMCNGILQELTRVEAKRGRGMVQRYAEAREDSEEVIECYRRIHNHLTRLTLNANLNIWKTVEGLVAEARLKELSSARAAEYNSAKAAVVERGPCTQGTREEELVRLLAWARDDNTGGVCWINGMAGTGKTTIAYSLCDALRKSSELAASFFCSRQIPECRNVEIILPSIAYQLARFSRPFCGALLQVLQADPDIHARELKTQFESLIVGPLLAVRNSLPSNMVVVIDALDECESKNSIGWILDVLLSHTSASDLPIRFLVSSRPESEIYERMTSESGVDFNARLVLHELDKTRVKQDIETYLKHELRDIPLPASRLSALVEKSGVLFIFASTAARYINDGRALDDYEERLDSILGLSPLSLGEEHGIDELYSTILYTAFANPKLTVSNRSQMKTILDTVMCAQEPLTINALARLLNLKSGKQVDGLLRPLYSVLNISETTGLVSTLHASFPDFMRSSQRSESFCCDWPASHGRLAEACFRIIRTNEPQFNICRLNSSYIRDTEVPNFNQRVEEAISPELFYACRYWIVHLRLGKLATNISELLYDFLSARLLLWMEVLNMKKSMYIGPAIMQNAESWSREHDCGNEIIELAHDAWRFVTLFAGHAVSQSTPHIYVSMLPFWPESGPITEHYARRIQRAIEPQGTALSRRQLALLATWTFTGPVESACYSPDGSKIALGVNNCVYVVQGTTGQKIFGPLEHKSKVWSVDFSPDGVHVASSSDDGAIRVWNTARDVALPPFLGHAASVLSVRFSPDGTYIVSGSVDMTIRVWGAQSGKVILRPLYGHTAGVAAVCFSPDGTRIISGSWDQTIRIWDTQTGDMILGPFEEHADSTASFGSSHDGTRIVSGIDNGSIRIWDIQTGQPIIGPIQGHARHITAVCFSPDDTHIVSGSFDGTIKVWDAQVGNLILGPLIGHSAAVHSVCYSTDGAQVLSTSADKTVRIWDLRSGNTIQDSFHYHGHSNTVNSVSFSPDKTYIVSGSDDMTVRVWDTKTGEPVLGPLEGHTASVDSVCLSPDGTRIASSSYDMTIRIWDVQTGKTILGPLQGHTNGVFSVHFSPDSNYIVSGSYDRVVRMWDLRDGQSALFEGHSNVVYSVCFCPNGTRIASGSRDRTIRVWDVETRDTILGPLEGHMKSIFSVCFSPDGTRIVSGSDDRTIRVWDAENGQLILGPLIGHNDWVNSVVFSPNGTHIASSSNDMTIRVWDLQSGNTTLGPLKGHTGGVRSVRFSSDGRHLVSGSRDSTIRVWAIDSLEFIEPTSLKVMQESDFGSIDIGTALENHGWVTDSESRILAWVPHDLWIAIPQKRNTLLLSTHGCLGIRFNFSQLGQSWAKCYK